MPVYLGQGLNYKLRGYLNTDMRMSRSNDISVLDKGVSPQEYLDVGIGVVDADFLVFGYWPVALRVMMAGLSIPPIIGLVQILFGVIGPGDGINIGAGIALIVVAVLCWRAHLRYRYRKFVVFDRARGLIHIPQFFGKSVDRIRFEDASIIMMDRPSYLGINRIPHMIIVRPGWDLLRDGGNPPRLRCIDLKIFGNAREMQALWCFIVLFMSRKLDSARQVSLDNGFASRQDLYPTFARFDEAMLRDDLTWWRDDDGRWHRLDETAGGSPRFVCPPVHRRVHPMPFVYRRKQRAHHKRAKAKSNIR